MVCYSPGQNISLIHYYLELICQKIKYSQVKEGNMGKLLSSNLTYFIQILFSKFYKCVF